MIKTRFAPSPTGYLHLGNIRTALFCALLARKEQGIFLLRVEDTDQLRSGAEFAEQLEYDLRWLGLEWQEGPQVGGTHGPYFQSKRQAIYAEYFQKLEGKQLVYPCFCTEQELAIARKVQLTSGQAPRYLGTCRNLTTEQIAEKRSQGLIPTLRFKVPDKQILEFNDFVRGPQRFVSNDIGDFVIRRGDGSAAFFFCNAIDDAVMVVTHVLRGEDHLTNTPRQLMLLQALGLPQPQYGHMPMIIGPDGSPLSKRHGSRSIKVLHKLGYLPLAIDNYLARLGHYYTDNSLMTLEQLAENFSVKNIGSSPARYDETQLLYWQKQAIQQLTAESFWNWLGENIQELIPAVHKAEFIAAVQSNIVFPDDAKQWAQIIFGEGLEFNEEAIGLLKQAGIIFFDTALQSIEEGKSDFKSLTQILQQVLNIKGKALYQPLRLALTGRLDGPEIVKILSLLGDAKIKSRFQAAKDLAK